MHSPCVGSFDSHTPRRQLQCLSCRDPMRGGKTENMLYLVVHTTNMGYTPRMFDRCLYFNTNALARRLNARWEKAFADTGLSPAHGYLVRLVLQHPGIAQNDLAPMLQLEKSTVTRFLYHLEKQAWLTRQVKKENARCKSVYPTRRARAMQAQLSALGDDLYDRMCAALGQDEVDALVKTLRKVALMI